MIANFYKKTGTGARDYKLITSKNIDSVPQKGTYVKFSGQLFTIDKVCFDVDICEYNFYVSRV